MSLFQRLQDELTLCSPRCCPCCCFQRRYLRTLTGCRFGRWTSAQIAKSQRGISDSNYLFRIVFQLTNVWRESVPEALECLLFVHGGAANAESRRLFGNTVPGENALLRLPFPSRA